MNSDLILSLVQMNGQSVGLPSKKRTGRDVVYNESEHMYVSWFHLHSFFRESCD